MPRSEFLGGFELLVLLALVRLGDGAYGVPISLLQRLGVNDSIIGDLVERYQTKQSSAWFGRQALTAVLLGAFRGVRDHKLRAAGALVTGCCVLELFGLAVRHFLENARG